MLSHSDYVTRCETCPRILASERGVDTKRSPLDTMTPDQKRIYQLTVKERGQVPGPYKICLQNPKLMEVMVPVGA
jgi:hypothetical protein